MNNRNLLFIPIILALILSFPLVVYAAPQPAAGGGGQSARIDDIEQRLDDLEPRVATLVTDLTTANTRIGTLETDLGTAQTNLAAANTRIGTLEDVSIPTLETALTTARSDISTLQSDLAMANATISTLTAGLVTAQADILALQNEQTNLGQLADLAPFVIVDLNPINELAGPHIIFEGANVHVRSGSGGTTTPVPGGEPPGPGEPPPTVALGNLVIGYNEVRVPTPGPPPGPDDQALDRKATGSVRLDIHTGQIGPIGEMAALPEPELPPAVSRLKDAQALPGRVWRVSDALVAIKRATYEGKQRVTLKRWDAETGEALADVTLFDGGLNFRSVSADQRHLLASRRDVSDSRIWEWAVFSLETGAKVAELRHNEPGAWFFVSGFRLIHETNVTLRDVGGQVVVEPGKLRAVDLETGTEVWSHAIRDIKYRGPYPPRTAR